MSNTPRDALYEALHDLAEVFARNFEEDALPPVLLKAHAALALVAREEPSMADRDTLLHHDVPGVLRCASIAMHRGEGMPEWSADCRAHHECRIYAAYCAEMKRGAPNERPPTDDGRDTFVIRTVESK